MTDLMKRETQRAGERARAEPGHAKVSPGSYPKTVCHMCLETEG